MFGGITYRPPITNPFRPEGSIGANVDIGSTGVYNVFNITQTMGWMNQGKNVGIGYAQKAHDGVYLQIDWPSFNRFVATQLYAGAMGAKKGILEVGRKLHKKIKDRNPVLTGLSKAAWEFRTTGLASKEKPFVVIANQVYYTVSLEFGSSKKAPHGMVRISMKEMMGIPAAEILKQLRIQRNKFKTFKGSIPAGSSRTMSLGFGV